MTSPENLRHKFTQRSVIAEYRTTNHGDRQILTVRLEYAERSVDFFGVKAGMISLTTVEKKNQSLVLEQVLESIFWT